MSHKIISSVVLAVYWLEEVAKTRTEMNILVQANENHHISELFTALVTHLKCVRVVSVMLKMIITSSKPGNYVSIFQKQLGYDEISRSEWSFYFLRIIVSVNSD